MDSRRHLLFFSLLQGIAICVICQHWGVTVPSKMSAVEGSCLVIPCTYTYSPFSPPHKFEAVWYQYVSRGYPLVYSKTGDIIAKFQGRTELVGDVEKGNCSLKISDMTIHDSSEKIYPWIDPDHVSYRTYAFYDSTVTIEVSGSAQAPEMTVKGALTEGESFDVYCSTVHNCPSSPPSFYFGDTRFSANHTAESDGRWRSAAVFSQKAQHVDNGKTINCTVRHSGGKTATSGITLNIAYAPRNVNISTKSQIVQAGSNISLSCTSDGNPTPDQFQWYQYNGSTSLGLNQFSRDIMIRIIEKDESWFYCVAHNSLGQANSSLITVIAEYKPAISLESHCFIYQGSITCRCLAKARPVALVEWSVNGIHPHAGFNVNTTSNNHLVKGYLMGHTHTENLVVFCKATNTYGSDQLTLQVFVKERPKNVSLTQIPKKVEEGNPVTLFCQSEGYPPASSFHWYTVQNGQGVKLNGESQTFLIAKATRDQGPFYCTVYNEIGQTSSAILPLNVEYAPAVLADSHCTLDGGTIRCECVVDSSPLSSITWKINGTAPPQGFNMSTTVRENLNIGVMTGKIETNDLVINCTATNRLGEESFQLPIRGIFNWKIIYSIVGGAALLIILCIMIGCRKYLSSSAKGTSKANSKDMVMSNLTPQTKQKEEDLTGTNERAYEIEYPRSLLCKNKAVEEAVYENLQATGSKIINKEMSFTFSL